MNPNKRPPPSSAGTFDGGDGLRDATKRARDFPDGKILRPGQEQPGNVLLVRVTDIVHPVSICGFLMLHSGDAGRGRRAAGCFLSLVLFQKILLAGFDTLGSRRVRSLIFLHFRGNLRPVCPARYMKHYHRRQTVVVWRYIGKRRCDESQHTCQRQLKS